MSRAVPGDGKLRASIAESGKSFSLAAEAYFANALENESKTKNNMTAKTAKEEMDRLEKIKEGLEKTLTIMGQAHEHHDRQTSVLKNNIFGGRRRIQADGSVKVLDDFDPVKAAETMKKYGYNEMTDPQKMNFMVRGHNPKKGFEELDLEAQRRYLIGEED